MTGRQLWGIVTGGNALNALLFVIVGVFPLAAIYAVFTGVCIWGLSTSE